MSVVVITYLDIKTKETNELCLVCGDEDQLDYMLRCVKMNPETLKIEMEETTKKNIYPEQPPLVEEIERSFFSKFKW